MRIYHSPDTRVAYVELEPVAKTDCLWSFHLDERVTLHRDSAGRIAAISVDEVAAVDPPESPEPQPASASMGMVGVVADD